MSLDLGFFSVMGNPPLRTLQAGDPLQSSFQVTVAQDDDDGYVSVFLLL